MNNIETMKLALEAFGEIAWSNETEWQRDRAKQAITSLRQAIEQAQQAEPVAYGTWDTMIGYGSRMMMVRLDKGQDGCTVPLYTSPPPRQPEQPKVRTGNCLRVGVCASEGHKIAPPRQPLTDEEEIQMIAELAMVDASGSTNGVARLGLAGAEEALAIFRAAHGIKENNT